MKSTSLEKNFATPWWQLFLAPTIFSPNFGNTKRFFAYKKQVKSSHPLNRPFCWGENELLQLNKIIPPWVNEWVLRHFKVGGNQWNKSTDEQKHASATDLPLVAAQVAQVATQAILVQGHDITNPNNAQFLGKSFKFTMRLHQIWSPPKSSHSMSHVITSFVVMCIMASKVVDIYPVESHPHAWIGDILWFLGAICMEIWICYVCVLC